MRPIRLWLMVPATTIISFLALWRMGPNISFTLIISSSVGWPTMRGWTSVAFARSASMVVALDAIVVDVDDGVRLGASPFLER